MRPLQSRVRAFLRAAALVLALLLCAAALPAQRAYAQETPADTVRVGFYPVANYQETRADGMRTGFSYDYFMQIQKYTRWDYEFVEASYAECMAMLRSGEIDLMSGVLQTDDRQTEMLFSRYSVSNSQNKLYAAADNQTLYYESYDSFDGCRVAIMNGTLHSELDSYCADHGFSLTLVEYATPAQMGEALLRGEVDMICASSVSNDISTKIVAHMDKVPLYYAVSTARPELLTELNQALRMIVDNNPDFYAQMSEKYMVSGANAIATFTREELDYLQSGQKMYVIMNASWAPISWYDQEAGAYRGIFVDVVEKIKAYSGLDYVLCTEEEFNSRILPENPEAVNNVVAILADDNSWAVTQNVLMSNHVVDASVVMVTKRSSHQTEQQDDLRIALPDRFYISWCLQNDYAPEQISYYGTVAECMDAINAGEADATFVNELVATYFLSKLEYSGLFATANSGYNENLAFAVNKDSQQPLLGILDKSLLCIGADELNQIVISNSIAEQRVSFRGLYDSNPGMVIFLICLLVLLLGAVAVVLLLMRARRLRLARELERDAETRLARTEFFMMISHELRTPLNAVVGYLELAAEQSTGNGPETEYLNRSRSAAKQLSRIAEDMLDYTRIASDSAELHEEVFDLKTTVYGLEQNISLAAEKKGLSFKFSVSDLEVEYVVGDRLRLAQIMQNLLSNAVKFTDAGGSVFAEISQKKTEDGRLSLIFTVRDTGRGMSEDYLKTVCAPFLQGDKAYSRTHGGLGLGLYLTKYYLHAMHGQLEVESSLGVGSTFTVHVTLSPADSSQIPGKSADLSRIRVVIGGTDEKENGQLRDTLKRLGMKSDILSDGEKLVKRILSRSTGDYAYTLCLLDESLIDGEFRILQEIAQQKNAPEIFALSGSVRGTELLSAQPQIRHVLYKPIFQSVLFNAILEDFGAYPTENRTIPNEDFNGARAMIVEDNRVNSDILMRILRRANVQPTLCENGKEAVDAFLSSEPGHYQFILMDIQMPVMDGYTATKAIRMSTHPQAKEIPILAVSANAFPEDIEKSLSAGMNEHLSKPIDVKKLYKLLRTYLQP